LEESLEIQGKLGARHGFVVALNNIGVATSIKGNGEHIEIFEKTLGATLGIINGMPREALISIIENVAVSRLKSNQPFDDLFEYIEGKVSESEFKILKGWHQIRNGHSLASQGRWSEAREQLKMGEGVIGDMNDRQPSNLIHMMTDGVDAYED